MEGDETIMANKKLLKEWEEEKGIRIRKRKHNEVSIKLTENLNGDLMQ